MTRNGKVEFVPEVFGCVEPAVAQQIESGGSGVELATAHEVESDCSDCNIVTLEAKARKFDTTSSYFKHSA